MKMVNFGKAIIALKNNKRVCRACWMPDIFVFRQIPATIGRDIVPKMQSLPQSVKDEFQRRFESDTFQIDAIFYDDQLAHVGLSNRITSYSPSVSDTLAVDWIILD